MAALRLLNGSGHIGFTMPFLSVQLACLTVDQIHCASLLIVGLFKGNAKALHKSRR